MKELQKLLSSVRRAAEHYDMIAPGDRIAVGLSGGKDSAALLYTLAKLMEFYPAPFTLCGISVDLGFPGKDGLFEPVSELCASLGVEYRVVETQIAEIVFDARREKNPCSLCAKLRRGALNGEAAAMGIHKVALGHHLDDAAETFMMSLLFEGRIGCFSPVTVYEDRNLTVIRPLVYTRESEVRSLVRAAGLPVIESPCPENGSTERAEMKRLLHSLEREHRGLYERLLGAMERKNIDGWETSRGG